MMVLFCVTAIVDSFMLLNPKFERLSQPHKTNANSWDTSLPRTDY